MFSSSPLDPRYHMLQYISSKFTDKIQQHVHEPRAALFLNRFSRTLTIMYATNGLADLLGISADQLNGKSFYYCIQENCLREAVKCLESAKANDSIAYLRFWFRDPRHDDQQDRDEHMSDAHSSGDDDEGGVNLSELMDHDGDEGAVHSHSDNSLRSSAERDTAAARSDQYILAPNSRSSSDTSTNYDGNANDPIFDPSEGGQSRTSSISSPDESQAAHQPWSGPNQVELEAVVSCTSDGLVVILRRARHFVPHIPQPASEPPQPVYANGFFASPWAKDPILPQISRRANPLPNNIQPAQFPIHPTAPQANTAATKGPATEDFMNSIREVAVFAWSLTGINGSLAQYGRGTPTGESMPPDGLSIWDPNFQPQLGKDQKMNLSNGGPHYTTKHQPTHQNGQPYQSYRPQQTTNGNAGGWAYENGHAHPSHQPPPAQPPRPSS